jgi:uncharacterized membrane protein
VRTAAQSSVSTTTALAATPAPLLVVGSFEVFRAFPLYSLALLLASAAVVTTSQKRDVPVSDGTILAFMPWVAIAGALTVVGKTLRVPETVTPFLTSPLVYLTTFVVAGAVWLAVTRRSRPDSMWSVDELLALSGVFLLAPVVGAAVTVDIESLHPFWPLIAVLVSLPLTWLVWEFLRLSAPEAAVRTGWLGVAVVFGHALDGMTTLIGIDLMGFSEQTPLPRSILEYAATLPTAELIGVGWLFLLVKLLVAVAIVRIVGVGLSDRPLNDYLMLGLTAAAGLGPGFHNVFLYTIL